MNTICKDLQILESCSIYLVYPTQPAAGFFDLLSWNTSNIWIPTWFPKQHPRAERDTIHIPEADDRLRLQDIIIIAVGHHRVSIELNESSF